jgi:hypothetical protein
MMKGLIIIVIGTVALLSITVATSQQRIRSGACAADIKEKCAGVKPGEGRISACVKEHLKDLSEPCQARLAKFAATGNACKADVDKSCADKKRSRIRVIACMKETLGNLSDQCKDAMAEAVGGRK